MAIEQPLQWPLVSILMPIRNEAKFLAYSLGSVLNQDYPPDRLEVLVADGMSNDNTREVIAQIAAKHPQIPIRVLNNPYWIVPTALNIALKEAKGDILIRVDGHCEIAPTYVSRCVAHLTTRDIDGVGGPIETVNNTVLGQAIAIAMSTNFGVGGSTFRVAKNEEILVDTIAFPAYKREAVERAGPFDEELVRNQDDEYNYRLRSMGSNLLLAPNVQSKYYSRSSLLKLWRQYFQYGYWKVRVMQKYPRQMRPRQFVPLALVTLLGIGALLALFSQTIFFLWVFTLGLYVTANIYASIRTAFQRGWKYLIWLPLAFGVLHFSYGIGFLLGLVKFAGRWEDKATYRRTSQLGSLVQAESNKIPEPTTTSTPMQPKDSRTKVSLVIPAYNEAEGVPLIDKALRPVMATLRKDYDLQVIFVNDGSEDNTFELLTKTFGNDPEVCIATHDINCGLGAALRTGFKYVEGDIVVTTDFDGTYGFDLIPQILERLNKDRVDIVTASPYHPHGGQVDGVPPFRLLLSRGASFLYRLLVHWDIYTWTAIFRAYRRPVIQKLWIESDGFLACTELLVKALQRGYTISEFPATLGYRTYGRSSMKIVRTIRAHLQFQCHILITLITAPSGILQKKV